MSIDVSVIIAVYNAEKYLSTTLDCVVGQTLKNIEIICIDDGSADDSAGILMEYALRDNRVRVIRRENQGAGAARNIGIEEASGKYISVLDADDLFEPDMLETAFGEAEKHKADLVIFENDRFDSESGALIPSGRANFPLENPFSAGDVMDDMFTFCFNVAWNMLINRQYVIDNKLRFQNSEQHNDAYFSVCCKLMAKRMCYINKVLAHYRKNIKSSISSHHTGKKEFFPVIKVLTAIHEKILEAPGYETMLRSFIIYSSYLVLFNLNQIRGEYFFRAFELLKKEWFSRFPDEAIREENYDSAADYLQCRSIIDNDVITHLFLLLDVKMKENQSLRANKRWYFSDPRVCRGDRVIIYGAGEIGEDYYNQLSAYAAVTLVDRAHELFKGSRMVVRPPETIPELEFEWVIVTPRRRGSVNQILRALTEYGVPDAKVILPAEL